MNLGDLNDKINLPVFSAALIVMKFIKVYLIYLFYMFKSRHVQISVRAWTLHFEVANSFPSIFAQLNFVICREILK